MPAINEAHTEVEVCNTMGTRSLLQITCCSAEVAAHVAELFNSRQICGIEVPTQYEARLQAYTQEPV